MFANVRQEQSVTQEMVFRIASISKTITAIGLMQLWEQGKFQLDAPVNEYLNAYHLKLPDPHVPPVTFRHLLTHTSGLGTMRSSGRND
jgi:CubicO group peptidase (beta-lactamase class C family)